MIVVKTGLKKSDSILPIASITIIDAYAKIPIEIIHDKWQIAYLYTVKYVWSSKIKIHPAYYPYKSLGYFAYKLYRLVVAVEGFKRNTNFNNAVDLFKQLLLELFLIEVHDCNNGIKIIERSWKKSFIALEAQKLSKLRNYKNPYKDIPDVKIIVEFFDTVINFAEQANGFNQEFYKPFLKAYLSYINDLKTNQRIKHGFIKNGEYILQIGGGKSSANKRKIKIDLV
jgi:hypothetical protein